MSDVVKVAVQCSSQNNMSSQPNAQSMESLRDSLAHSVNIAVETAMASQSLPVHELDVVVEVGNHGERYHFGPNDFVSGHR